MHLSPKPRSPAHTEPHPYDLAISSRNTKTGSVHGHLIEHSSTVATFRRGACSPDGYLAELTISFFNDAAKSRFEAFAGEESISEALEALGV